MPSPLFPEPKQREPKPPFESVPAAILFAIAETAGSAVVSGEAAFGGLSASANYILTLENGTKIFAKGSHPGDTSHGTETLRQEIFAYQNIPSLKKLSPAYIGKVSDGDEDGWSLGLWEYLDWGGGPDVAAAFAALAVFQSDAAAKIQLGAAEDHIYLRLFLSQDKKWRRLRDEPVVRDRFLTLFTDVDEGRSWADRNLPRLADLQSKNFSPKSPCGMIHGDLRLDNFLFSPRGARVIDWPNACYGLRIFDTVFLAMNVEGLGILSIEECLRLYAASGGTIFSHDDVMVMLAKITGYFADQAYRDVPQNLPRLRWMQKCMLMAGLQALHRAGHVDSLPPMRV